MDNQPNHATPPQAATGTPLLDAKGAARRRFTRLGAGATGVILTLHSQPGMAAEGLKCVAPSGFMSMKTAAATTTSLSPQGNCSSNRSHGYWKNHADDWARLAGVDHAAKFGNVFLATGNYEGLAEVSLMDVLTRPTKEIKEIDQSNVAMQTVTAFLNARVASLDGTPTVLPEELVQEIWGQYVRHGYYSPSTGAFIWHGAMIAEYLESTFR